MSPDLVGIIGIVALVVVLFSGIPVGVAIFVVGFVGFGYLVSFPAALSSAAKDFFAVFSSYTFTVIPAFLLMGYLAFATGISRRLYDAAYAWVGHIRGGLAMATILAATIFGALCGSGPATAATMAVAALPEMRKYNYDTAMATASVAVGGILDNLIPPSLLFVVYGILTENSIAALFLAGIFPGILFLLLFAAVIYILTSRNPALGPAGIKVGFKEKIATLGSGTAETLIIFAVVMGGLVAGFFTATEGGAIGAAAIFVLGIARRQIGWNAFTNALTQTARTAGMIFLFIAGVTVFGRFLAVTQIPMEVADFTVGLSLPKGVLMFGILFIHFLAGCFIDPLPFMMLTIPVFYPLVIQWGFDPIWYGVMMVVMAGLGGITPPVGLLVYVVGGIARDVPLQTIFRGAWPFVVAMVVGIALLILFPQIATFLPNLMTAAAK